MTVRMTEWSDMEKNWKFTSGFRRKIYTPMMMILAPMIALARFACPRTYSSPKGVSFGTMRKSGPRKKYAIIALMRDCSFIIMVEKVEKVEKTEEIEVSLLFPGILAGNPWTRRDSRLWYSGMTETRRSTFLFYFKIHNIAKISVFS
jgi:hypothetical protein